MAEEHEELPASPNGLLYPVGTWRILGTAGKNETKFRKRAVRISLYTGPIALEVVLLQTRALCYPLMGAQTYFATEVGQEVYGSNSYWSFVEECRAESEM